MIKRVADVFVAASALLVLSPVLAVIAVAVRILDGRPVLYRQARIGRGGVPFVLLKFRSMRPASGASITVAGDHRVTALGRVLRRYKLDELPQLWNVLVGQMSLVGPRPEIAKYVDLDDARWREVLRVRPGITDVASLVYRNEEEQLAGRSDPERYYREVLLPEKLRLSLGYLAHQSIFRDLKLIVLTALASAMPAAVDADRLKHVFSSRS